MPPDGRRAVSEREGASAFLRISAVVVLTMFYTLGAVSLYVRARWLKPTPTATPRPTAIAPSPTWTPFPTWTPAPPTATPTVTPTLYPTMTPKLPPTPKG